MFPLLRRRPLVWLALFAWVAQLGMPAAHAALMAQQDPGLGTWCGSFSPALSQKFAALPDEVRRILRKDSAHSESRTDCQQFCSGVGAEGPASLATGLALHAGPVDAPVPVLPERPREQYAPRPPPRGPPSES